VQQPGVAQTLEDDIRRDRRLPGRARRAALLATALLGVSAGCASPRDDDLFGMTLEVRTQQPWASDPELPRRVHDLVATSCAYIGLDPSLLWGMTLRIEDDGIGCGGVADARGCTWREAGVVAVSTLAWTTAEPRVPCVEDTPIPHELLHVKIGDPTHSDPRWSDPAYWGALSARVPRSGCSGDPPSLIW
jgi:hypothetical protein